MNLSELWIGDKIKLLKSGRTGTFEGISSNGKLRVKIYDKYILTNKNNIEVIESDFENLPEEIEPEVESNSKKRLPDVQNSTNVIDLHLEKLDPEFKIPPIRALDYQIEKCRQFINQSIQNNFKQVVIIHGKGSGILKTAIKEILKDYPEVYFTFEVNKGGATEVWLS